MKQEKQRVFSNVTATDVVKLIAKEYGFKADADAHPRVYPQISQPGISDFQLLARLAQQCGYTMFIDNTTIKFKNVTTDYNKHRDNAEKFTVREANDPAGSTLYSFNLTLGESVRYADAYKSSVQVNGVDPLSKVISSITNQTRNTTLRKKANTEIFDNYATDTVAPTSDAAYYEALSADERNRFPYRANVQVIGAPSITPGMPIYLDGLHSLYDGYWVVLSCEHHIDQTTNNNILKYTCFVEIGIDSLRGANKLNNVSIDKPATIKKRAIVPGVRNTPTLNSSRLTQGTDKYTNYLSDITTRAKGSEYDNKKGHFWVFDGQTTTEYVTKKTKSNLSILRKG
jgi:phage protein D